MEYINKGNVLGFLFVILIRINNNKLRNIFLTFL